MRVMVFHNFSKRITNFCIELIGAIATSKFSVVANRSVDVTFCLPEKFEGRGDEILGARKALHDEGSWSCDNGCLEIAYVMRLFIDVA